MNILKKSKPFDRPTDPKKWDKALEDFYTEAGALVEKYGLQDVTVIISFDTWQDGKRSFRLGQKTWGDYMRAAQYMAWAYGVMRIGVDKAIERSKAWGVECVQGDKP